MFGLNRMGEERAQALEKYANDYGVFYDRDEKESIRKGRHSFSMIY